MQTVMRRLAALGHATHTPLTPKQAAVFVPLFAQDDSVHVWLCVRSRRLTAHPAEVCLPGGKRDPGDADDTATALREAQEEIGFPPSAAQVLCSLPPFLSKHSLSVVPVVGVVPASFVPRPNAAEVAHVFHMPLASFLAADNHLSWDITLPASRAKLRMHSFKHDSQVVWGLTAAILIKVASLALEQEPGFQLYAGGAPLSGADRSKHMMAGLGTFSISRI